MCVAQGGGCPSNLCVTLGGEYLYNVCVAQEGGCPSNLLCAQNEAVYLMCVLPKKETVHLICCVPKTRLSI